MKKTLRVSLIVTLAATSIVWAGGHKKKNKTTSQEPRIINLQEFVQAVAQGYKRSAFQDVILECPAGTVLPLKLSMQSDLFAFETNSPLPSGIRLLKPCYLKYQDKKHFLISSDGLHWQEFAQFFSSKTNAALGMENNFFPFADLQVEVQESIPKFKVL